MSLAEQWHRQSALLRQIRSSAEAPRSIRARPTSPTCGSRGRRAARSLPRARHPHRVRRAHRRLAPCAGLAPLLPLPAGRRLRGGVRRAHAQRRRAARRTVRIRDGALERVEAPEGVFVGEDASGWKQVQAQQPRLAGGEGCGAARPRSGRRGAGTRLGTDLQGARRRLDKRLPEITSLIDPAQFALITRPGGFSRSAAAPARARPRWRCTASRTSPTTIRASTPSARSSWSSPRDCASTCATSCPRSASRASASPPSESGRTSSGSGTSRGCRPSRAPTRPPRCNA